jgi:hypothetical protein
MICLSLPGTYRWTTQHRKTPLRHGAVIIFGWSLANRKLESLLITSACLVIQEEESLTAAEIDAACGILPRAAHRVTRDGRSIFLAGSE